VRVWRGGVTLIERRGAIDAHRLAAICVAAVEPGSVVRRHVPFTTHLIVDVLAIARGVLTLRVTNAETEFAWADEIRPFENFFYGPAKGVGEDDTADRVAVSIGAVGIQFSSSS